MLQCVCRSVYIAVCVLQYVAVCALQGVAVCVNTCFWRQCSAFLAALPVSCCLSNGSANTRSPGCDCCSVLQCALRYVAVCCSVLQCVAVCVS